MLADSETKVASFRKVALAELVLLDLETALENFLGLGATDGNVDSNLLVTTDTEGTDSVAGLAYEINMSDAYPSIIQVETTHCKRGFDR